MIDYTTVARTILDDIPDKTAEEMKSAIEGYEQLKQKKEKEVKELIEPHLKNSSDSIPLANQIRELFLA